MDQKAYKAMEKCIENSPPICCHVSRCQKKVKRNKPVGCRLVPVSCCHATQTVSGHLDL